MGILLKKSGEEGIILLYIEITFGQIIATSHEGKSRLVKYSNLARLHRD